MPEYMTTTHWVERAFILRWQWLIHKKRHHRLGSSSVSAINVNSKFRGKVVKCVVAARWLPIAYIFFLSFICPCIVFIHLKSKECQKTGWATHQNFCFKAIGLPESVLLALLAPVRVQGIYEDYPWSPTRIEQATRKFESHFATSLLPIAHSALVTKWKTLNNGQPWVNISTTYGYQFTLGLADATNIAKGRKRLGLKAGKLIRLEEYVDVCVSLQKRAVCVIAQELIPSLLIPDSRETKLAGIRSNILSKNHSVTIILAVESSCGTPYCPPCSFVHEITPSPVRLIYSNSLLFICDS